MATQQRTPAARATYPLDRDRLPEFTTEDRRYRVRMARDEDELRAIQALRFRVFNLELGEGLAESFATGLDQDRFDPVCHHLLVEERATDEVIGTYRLQTASMAEAHEGFYSAGEFDLAGLTRPVIEQSVELGRACVAAEHRNRRVLFLLWRGLAAYMLHNHRRYFFGCCSLTSQDPHEAWRVMAHLRANGQVRSDLAVRPLPGWECDIGDGPPEPGPVKVPKLFRMYLRYGAQVCGPPAIDRCFKTIDYLVLVDSAAIDPGLYRMIFE